MIKRLLIFLLTLLVFLFDTFATMASTKKIILKSSDGKIFEIDESLARKSVTIQHMIDDECADEAIPLPNITGPILAKVIEYLKKHVESAADTDNKDSEVLCHATVDEAFKKWDEEFVKVDQPTLFGLMRAANYLHISELLDLTCKTVSDMMIRKTPEQIRTTFNIVNDYTAEEEAEVREENKWAFE